MQPIRGAVVGLGQMGAGIAANLDASGLLVAVHDTRDVALRFSVSVKHLAGQELVDHADVILFTVPSCAEVGAALEGCHSDQPTIIIDLTTSDPSQSTALATDLSTRGFHYIDAAMTGGAAGADTGTLTLMIGGAPDDVAACQEVFDAIANQSFHLGPTGSGHTMKLIHNLILHSSFLATCEGLLLADRAGLDLGQAVDVLNAGNARSFVTEVRFPRDILSGTMNARSAVSNLAKDLGLAVGFADAQDGPAPYAALTHNLLNEAVSQGQGSTDFSHLFPLYEALATSLEHQK